MKILFVCKGNICRSPMAEGIMKALLHDRKLDINVDSAATHDYNIGSSPDSRAYLTCKNYQIDISYIKARQIENKDFMEADSIFAMDSYNVENLLKKAPDQLTQSKIMLLSKFVYSEKVDEIPDPYNENEEYFEKIYQLIYEACTNILNNLNHELGKTIMQ